MAGVSIVYVDGSFATGKTRPNDYDACYSFFGVKSELMDPALLDFSNQRKGMKEKYRGEFFPADWTADQLGTPFLEFFQKDRAGRLRGIIALDLSTLP